MSIRLRDLPLLAIFVCMGCSEEPGQEVTGVTVPLIRAMAKVGDTLYLAANRDGVFRFNNKSQSWEWVDDTLVGLSLATDETTLYIGTRSGIYQLVQGSSTPTLITPLITTPQDEWNGSIEALEVEGKTIYAIRREKLIRSLDGGKSWHRVNGGWHDFQRIYSLARKGNTVYVFTARQGVFYSTDGGNSFSTINQGLPEEPSSPFVVFNRPLLLDRNTLYIGTTTGVYRLPKDSTSWKPAGLHDWGILSLATVKTALFAATDRKGLFRSHNGGAHWQIVGFAGSNIRMLFSVDNRLYVGTLHEGLFYSNDLGNTWHPLNKGLTLILE